MIKFNDILNLIKFLVLINYFEKLRDKLIRKKIKIKKFS